MQPIGDALDLLDEAFGRLPGEVAVPLLLLALIVAFRVVVRRVIPWLAGHVLQPVMYAVSGGLALAALTVEFVLTRAFRLVRLAPTRMHYAVGDVSLAGAAGMRSLTRSAVRQLGRLGRFSPFVLLVAAVAIIVWWSAGYCDRHAAAGCSEPLPAWARQVGEIWSPG